MNTNDKLPNAQKWTKEIVMMHLLEIEKEATEGNILFLSRALARRRISRYAWSYWKKVFCYEPDILEMMQLIDTILEANLLEGGLKKELAPYLTTLALKHNHQWKDKPLPEAKTEAELPAAPQSDATAIIKLPDNKVLIGGPGWGGIYQKVVSPSPEAEGEKKPDDAPGTRE
jgi:hypothetical protein